MFQHGKTVYFGFWSQLETGSDQATRVTGPLGRRVDAIRNCCIVQIQGIDSTVS